MTKKEIVSEISEQLNRIGPQEYEAVLREDGSVATITRDRSAGVRLDYGSWTRPEDVLDVLRTLPDYAGEPDPECVDLASFGVPAFDSPNAPYDA